MPETSQIIYTKIDEAPALATHSLLPILRAFTKGSGIELEAWDISLTGRIIANFPDNLTDEQKIPDYLSMSSVLCDDPKANIIKLPNISASIPQLKAAIKESQERDMTFPTTPTTLQTTNSANCLNVFRECWVARSTRSCGKGTPTAGQPSRLRNTANATPIG